MKTIATLREIRAFLKATDKLNINDRWIECLDEVIEILLERTNR